MANYAVMNGNLTTLKKVFLNKGYDINSIQSDGRTLLIIATSSGRLNVVKFLLENGANVNKVGGDKVRRMSPLHVAAYKGSIPIVQLLLENGANVNVNDMNGMTPLDYAKIGGHKEIIKLLFDNIKKIIRNSAVDRRKHILSLVTNLHNLKNSTKVTEGGSRTRRKITTKRLHARRTYKK